MGSIITALLSGVLLASGFSEKENESERAWHVKNESRLAISGASNVNDFRCEVDRYYNADDLHLYSSPGSDYLFSQNRIVIDLMAFDCGRKLVTRDFRESLNAEREPEMIINFLSINKLPADSADHQELQGALRVTIAGVTRDVHVKFLASNNGNGKTWLKGSHDLKFSDFGLIPPTKMLGLINVKNELEVSFDLILEEIN
jgi:hypothetical protein